MKEVWLSEGFNLSEWFKEFKKKSGSFRISKMELSADDVDLEIKYFYVPEYEYGFFINEESVDKFLRRVRKHFCEYLRCSAEKMRYKIKRYEELAAEEEELEVQKKQRR